MAPYENLKDPMETLKEIYFSFTNKNIIKEKNNVKYDNYEKYYNPNIKKIDLNGCLSDDGKYYSFIDYIPCKSSELVINPYIVK